MSELIDLIRADERACLLRELEGEQAVERLAAHHAENDGCYEAGRRFVELLPNVQDMWRQSSRNLLAEARSTLIHALLAPEGDGIAAPIETPTRDDDVPMYELGAAAAGSVEPGEDGAALNPDGRTPAERWATVAQQRAYEGGRHAFMAGYERHCPCPSQQDLMDAWLDGYDRCKSQAEPGEGARS